MIKKILFILTLIFTSIEVEALTKGPIDVTNTNIVEIQEYVDKGYLTYERLVNMYLDRIEKYNDEFNAIRVVNKNAINEAKKLDIEFKKSGRRSLLHGIPIIVKDNIDVKGFATTAGSKALTDSFPFNDAEIIKKLKEKGVIILAKSNMSEFAFSSQDSYSSFGHVRNAFDSSYTPYGSSGGSAVASALNFAPITLGTDTNSSIRLPASGNNVIGLRPTYNLISTKGILSYDKERDVVGPITDNIIDNAIFMSVLLDKQYYQTINDVKKIKVGVLNEFLKSDKSSMPIVSVNNSKMEELTKKMISQLKNEQVDIVYIDDFYSLKYDLINRNTIFGRIMCYDFNQYIKNTSSTIKNFSELLETKKFVQNLYEYNISCNQDLREKSLENINIQKKIYKDYVKKVMQENDIDVLLYPSLKSETFKLSEKNPDYLNLTRVISPTTGLPAINIPMGFINSLPYGVEILAQENMEDILFKISNLYLKNNSNNETPKPNLYETKNIKKLIDTYEKANYNSIFYRKESYQKYLTEKEKVTKYLTNYDEIVDELKLNESFENSINNLEPKINKTYYFYIGTILLLLLFLLIKVNKKKR